MVRRAERTKLQPQAALRENGRCKNQDHTNAERHPHVFAGGGDHEHQHHGRQGNCPLKADACKQVLRRPIVCREPVRGARAKDGGFQEKHTKQREHEQHEFPQKEIPRAHGQHVHFLHPVIRKFRVIQHARPADRKQDVEHRHHLPVGVRQNVKRGARHCGEGLGAHEHV